MRSDRWHFPRPALAKAYLNYFGLGLTSARGLFARRRMGKTEFLKQDFIPAAERSGYLSAYVNFWERPRDPSAALEEALKSAIELRGVRKVLKGLNAPVRRLKASGKVLGVAEAALEAELAEADKPFSASHLKTVMRQFDKRNKALILIIDEAQVLASEEHSDFAHALRAALDIRKDRLKVIFAGSSETTLRQMLPVPPSPSTTGLPLSPLSCSDRNLSRPWSKTSTASPGCL